MTCRIRANRKSSCPRSRPDAATRGTPCGRGPPTRARRPLRACQFGSHTTRHRRHRRGPMPLSFARSTVLARTHEQRRRARTHARPITVRRSHVPGGALASVPRRVRPPSEPGHQSPGHHRDRQARSRVARSDARAPVWVCHGRGAAQFKCAAFGCRLA